MTKDELKRELRSYRLMRAEEAQLRDELRAIESVLTAPRSPNYDGMPHSHGGSDIMTELVAKHIALQERYCHQLDRLAASQLRVEELIESLDAEARMVLRLRYIDGLAWEEICVQRSYSWRNIHYIHNRALDTILAVENAGQGTE